MNNIIKIGIIFLSAILTTINANTIDSLKPGEWYEVPNSHLQSVTPPESNARVMDPWSGGAFDTKRDQLIVWGGGHGDYSGNEIYTFSLDALKWKRENNPSSPPAVDVPYAADGGPCSRHTYDYIQYLSAIDRFCSFGGSGFYQSGQTGTSHTDAFDFVTKKWSVLADCPSSGIGAFSAVDVLTGHAWCHGTITSEQTRLAEYDPVSNKWTSHTGYNDDLQYAYYFTAAIDPVNKKFVATGHNQTIVWDISNPALITQRNLSNGPAAGSPGFDYDSRSKQLVSWSGGQSVNIFDVKTEKWSTVSGTGAIPTGPCQQGTFGRWRYCPSKNIFVLVNDVDENVFLYRLSDAKTTVDRRSIANKSVRQELAIKRTGQDLAISVGQLPCQTLAVYCLDGSISKDLTSHLHDGVVIMRTNEMRHGTYIIRADFEGEQVAKVFSLSQ